MKKTITSLVFAKRPPSRSITTRYKHEQACLEGGGKTLHTNTKTSSQTWVGGIIIVLL